MAHKKHGLFTLIKVGVISFFSTLYECALIMTNRKYDEYNKKIWYLFKLNLIILIVGITIAFITNIYLGKKSEIVFIIFLVIVFANIIYGGFCGIKQAFEIWLTFFKERLEKEDKEE
jgi:predicted permease